MHALIEVLFGAYITHTHRVPKLEQFEPSMIKALQSPSVPDKVRQYWHIEDGHVSELVKLTQEAEELFKEYQERGEDAIYRHLDHGLHELGGGSADYLAWSTLVDQITACETHYQSEHLDMPEFLL